MLLKQVLDIFEVVDAPQADGECVKEVFSRYGWDDVTVETVEGPKGTTDFIQIVIPGSQGKTKGGQAPTLGVIGRLGGLGARPEQIGYVSDGDGAVATLAAALKLADMQRKGDVLAGDVILMTHVCPDAPTQPHDPVPFMGSPVEIQTMNEKEVDPAMDAVISIDTTKGNRLVNHQGIAISAPVKEGWILRLSDDLLDTYQIVTGHSPVVLPINMQDITPYGNDVHHINSILQPAVATSAPVIGLAVTTEAMVPGSATGASHASVVELAARYSVEVAKLFGQGKFKFYDEKEYARLVELYGSMKHLQQPAN